LWRTPPQEAIARAIDPSGLGQFGYQKHYFINNIKISILAQNIDLIK